MVEIEEKKGSVKKIAIVVIFVFVISLFVLVILKPEIFGLKDRKEPPTPEIVQLDRNFARIIVDGYIAVVDVGVRNNGGAGWVTVYAELKNGGHYAKQEKRIHLASGETKNLKFTFDVSLWNVPLNSIIHRAWAVAS